MVEEWKDDAYCELLRDKKLYVDIPGICFLFETEGNVMKCRSVEVLSNNHLEADTKTCLHAINADQELEEPGNIVIRACDTDILVIMLYHSYRLKSNVWMDVGHSSNNSRRFINVTKIQKDIGPQVCAALPSFHAFSGSDFTSCFYMKGKVRSIHQFNRN